MKLYTGIGSRETPRGVCEFMTKVAGLLCNDGYTLRSGGARGADSAFELGVGNSNMKEIFKAEDADAAALELAKQFHPNWKACDTAARRLHARNMYQILGRDLNKRTEFVLCWTPCGTTSETTRATGGTGSAIRLAHAMEIPIFNFNTPEYNSKVFTFINDNS